jgi:hypothetical protein
MNVNNKRYFTLLAIAASLLLIPFIAMQFSSEVNWSPFDFAIMGILLFGTASLCELVLRRVKTLRSRILVCGAVLLLFFLVWAELAVGIFGTPLAGS